MDKITNGLITNARNEMYSFFALVSSTPRIDRVTGEVFFYEFGNDQVPPEI